MLKGWDGEDATRGGCREKKRRRRAVARSLERERERERGQGEGERATPGTALGVESEHHLVNSRVLFPSTPAPIGLRDHGGRSSSSSYFIRAVHAPPQAMLSPDPSSCT